jgi:hypothetical protein
MLDALQLATQDFDLDLVPASEARTEVRRLADALGVAITLRDPLTDDVIDVVQPTVQAVTKAA